MTEILCRVHTATRTPVVFVAGTVDYEARTVQCWIKGEPQKVSLNYYHETGPLSAADEEVLRKRYANNFNDPEVSVRHRLPRTNPVRENILAKPGRKPAGEAITSVEKANLKVEQAPVVEAPAANNTPSPQEIWQAIEAHRIETTKQISEALALLTAQAAQLAGLNGTRAGRRASIKKPAEKKAGRKPAAKQIQTKV